MLSSHRSLSPDGIPSQLSLEQTAVGITSPIDRTEAYLLNLLEALRGILNTGQDPQAILNHLPKLHEQLLVLSHLFHFLFQSESSCTQRDVYYHLSRFFPDQAAVNKVLLQVGNLIGCSRHELHVRAGCRGYVGGCISLDGVQVSSMGQQGVMVDSRLAMLVPPEGPPCGHTVYTPTVSLAEAKCILIVEKDAVFQRLMAERIFEYFPCVIVTGMGFPPLSVQAFVRYLADISPQSMRIVGLVDFNPSGVHILLQYLRGSKRFAGTDFAVPEVKWLGLRSRDLASVAPHLVHPFNDRDVSMAKRLLSQSSKLPPLWEEEVKWMAQHRLKADIECLYTLDKSFGHTQAKSFSKHIAHRIMQHDFI